MKILRPKEVCNMLSISMATLYNYIDNDPDFPPRVRLGNSRAVGFRQSDLEDYIEKNTESKKVVSE